MKIGGKRVGKGGSKSDASQHAKYMSGVYTSAGRRSGARKSSSKAHAMYNKAMKHSV
jgi:hypothetical protein